MSRRTLITATTMIVLAFSAFACSNPNPQPTGLTPVPTLAPISTVTLAAALRASPAPQAAATTQPAAGTQPAAAKPDSTVGGQIFQTNCAACHGARAEGGVGPALRANKFIQGSNDATVFATIAKGRPGTAMPAWLQANGGSLTQDQINNVIAYLRTLQ
jgi:mono/diheme cytochrome c family protein